MSEQEQYLTVKQIAKRLQVHPDTILRALARGELTGVRLGRGAGWRVSEADLRAWLDARSNRLHADRA